MPQIARPHRTDLYGATGIDFHDCYLAALSHLSHLSHDGTLSLDRDIDKLKRLLPG